MPPHEGHLFMCDVASELVDELSVLVCTRDCEPIEGNLRFTWMQASVKSNVQVLHLHRNIPQEPSEHPDFWNIWRETIQELHPESIDMVFGSEFYVNRLATELDAEPFVIDRERTMVPVSSKTNPFDRELKYTNTQASTSSAIGIYCFIFCMDIFSRLFFMTYWKTFSSGRS